MVVRFDTFTAEAGAAKAVALPGCREALATLRLLQQMGAEFDQAMEDIVVQVQDGAAPVQAGDELLAAADAAGLADLLIVSETVSAPAGSSGEGWADVTANALSLPAFTCGMSGGVPAEVACVRPATRSTRFGPVPL